ncbi:MAG TPA: serine/threonine-protein kinase, partial [Candidatus Eisenbacteria bacterium]|nr:serine/threonine-protein kinase [Candidatus Eisenbacteria bacterium]
MRLASGMRIGSYEVLGSLGAGGMGEVYRARDLRLGREVAIKVLPSDLASSSHRLSRFEREARAVASLNHPNIVTLYSVEDDQGIRFLTMELVDGRSLSRVITPGGLSLTKLLALAIPMGDALVAAHERGIVHRDLKPGNVMVTRDDRVKVLDFGLAKMTGRDEDGDETVTNSLSREGSVMGTVPYMAPEQLRSGETDA